METTTGLVLWGLIIIFPITQRNYQEALLFPCPVRSQNVPLLRRLDETQGEALVPALQGSMLFTLLIWDFIWNSMVFHDLGEHDSKVHSRHPFKPSQPVLLLFLLFFNCKVSAVGLTSPQYRWKMFRTLSDTSWSIIGHQSQGPEHWETPALGSRYKMVIRFTSARRNLVLSSI